MTSQAKTTHRTSSLLTHAYILPVVREALALGSRPHARQVGLDENFIALLDRERQYTSRLRDWQSYREWQENRNPARAALEARHGYDCKHASHLGKHTVLCRGRPLRPVDE